jgi:hypothetical protein
MMSRIDCWHWKISTDHHFQNGHHNTAKIQHCPISSKFDMWVDNDVPTLKISTGRHFQNGHHNTAKIQHCPISSKLDLWKSYSTHIWNGVEIVQCWICAVLWRPFWKWWTVEIFQCRESIRDIIIYPQIQFWWYRTMIWFLKLIADIENFLPVSIFKIATTIPHKFNIVRFQRHFICG